MMAKHDAGEIAAVLDGLRREKWLANDERKTWPLFLFHYTDLSNAIKVLQTGALLSRQQAISAGLLQLSSASPKVLDHTDQRFLDCVRLYFRPKTPTQYRHEGFKDLVSLSKSDFPDAHCPVPVFFLFSSAQVLSAHGVCFSDGNLSVRSPKIFSSAPELRDLPWEKIYHNKWMKDEEKQDIKYHRCAEVIIPKRLELENLKYIICRSRAEKDTLLNLLSHALRNQYAPIITATQGINCFFRKWTFIRDVATSDSQFAIGFSPETESKGTYRLSVDVRGEHIGFTSVMNDMCLDHSLGFKLEQPSTQYTAEIRIDGHIACVARHTGNSLLV